ncbi:hypothetical protein phiCT9441A_70 (endogenous virus) [Clostridium phage phiCT9441A]|uniref:hypothetical protein n=1 Tax=Clostridium phage phiCT9441A TaxID=1567014 RepID=UPI0005132DB7|nr:hypothetical protein [Clostridium tetani]YP_009219435.1 hypothetical protein phiCT9441A_70 [Clostridium phage phiCT9441A]AJA42682.1 hypothetical protein phiCT9441A_70 [Clostridium phage phiCT9441A]KGI40293.1 hypothetical protein LA33_06430 [Clostridium tetani ATCC 9441]SUY66168.1 Uncharacterised protein [Clostridium tetani]BDR66958.1 hypothetical protein K144312032_11860 [Clostridium tetani]
MNKRIKFITPILCGVLLSSSFLTVTNVQASTITKNNLELEISKRSIIPFNQKFSPVCGFSDDTNGPMEQIEKYIYKSVAEGTPPTAQGIRNILVKCGINRNIANSISFSLLDLAIKTGDEYSQSVFPETSFHNFRSHEEEKFLILGCGDGTYSLAVGNPSVKSYSIYGVLSNKDLLAIKKYDEENPVDEADPPWDWLEEALINTGVVKDPAMAHRFVNNSPLYSLSNMHVVQELIDLNENLYILMGDDNEHIVITREPR